MYSAIMIIGRGWPTVKRTPFLVCRLQIRFKFSETESFWTPNQRFYRESRNDAVQPPSSSSPYRLSELQNQLVTSFPEKIFVPDNDRPCDVAAIYLDHGSDKRPRFEKIFLAKAALSPNLPVRFFRS